MTDRGNSDRVNEGERLNEDEHTSKTHIAKDQNYRKETTNWTVKAIQQ